MKSLLVLCAACVAGLLLAAPSFATTARHAAHAAAMDMNTGSTGSTGTSPGNASSGYIEICKTGGAGVSGTFSFSVSGMSSPVSVGTGLCSAPMAVAAGPVTVTEAATTFTSVSAIASSPTSALTSSSLTTGTATVNVPASPDVSGTVTVTFTNILATGVMEICKNAATGSNLTGNFTFTLAGPMGYASTQSVPVGGCSQPITVPAGNVTVTETGSPAWTVSAISAYPASHLVSSSLSGGTATVEVGAGDVSMETIVTFTNSAVVSTLKICKVAGSASLMNTNASFTVSGVASPVVIPAGAAPGGNCMLVAGATPWAGGTNVTITEAPVIGAAVGSIDVAPVGRIVGTANLTTGAVTVALGAGETVVTYTNVGGVGGTMKICSTATGTTAAGAMATFTVTGFTGTVSVPAGACQVVGGSTNPFVFPAGSTPTITQTAGFGGSVSAITVNPANRIIGTANLAAGSVQVAIGSGFTEVAFTSGVGSGTDRPWVRWRLG